MVHEERDPGISQKFRVFLSPGVERPVHHREAPGLPVDHKRRPVVPEPDVGVIGAVKSDTFRTDAFLIQHRFDPKAHRFAGDEQVDGLGLTERRDDPDVSMLHCSKVGERLPVMGPGEPDGIVRFPLCRHTVAESPWGPARREPPGERPVGLRPPVPEEPPAFPDDLVLREIDLHDEDFLVNPACPGKNVSESVGNERTPEKPKTPLVAHPVDGGDVDAVCDRVAPLDRLPRLAPVAFRRFLPDDSADGGRVEDDIGTLQRDDSRRLREPLVVADEHGNPPVPGVVDPIAVPRPEVGLLVEEGVIGDVHLPVGRKGPSVGVDDRRFVVVFSGRSPLIKRHDDHHAVFAGKR